MSNQHAVSCTSAPTSQTNDRSSFVASAERVMGAFLSAVQNNLGVEASRRAGIYWIEAFEKAVCTSEQAGSTLKKITIAAASRLAQETSPLRLAKSSL